MFVSQSRPPLNSNVILLAHVSKSSCKLTSYVINRSRIGLCKLMIAAEDEPDSKYAN